MNQEHQTEQSLSQLPEAARESAHRAADAAREAAKNAGSAAKHVTHAIGDVAHDVSQSTRDATRRATDTARNIYRSASEKSGETLTTSRDYVRRNPVKVVLGAVAFGAAIGCVLMMARRKPTFGERYADEPLEAVREAILGALSPVTKRVHQGYDSARDGAGKAMNRVHRFGKARTCHSFSDQIGRIGNNLKFW